MTIVYYTVAPTPHMSEVCDRQHDDHIADTEHVGERPTVRNRKDVTEPRQPGVVHHVGVLEVADERRKTCRVPGPLRGRHRAAVDRDRSQIQPGTDGEQWHAG